MSDALTAGYELDRRDEDISNLHQQLDSQIEEVIRLAIKGKQYDEQKIMELLTEIEKVIPGRDSKYGIGYFDKVKLKLLGIIPYCERYKPKQSRN